MIRFTAFLLCAALATAAATSSAQAADAPATGAGPGLDVDTHLQIAPMVLVSFSAVAIAVGAGFGWEADELYDDWKAAKKAGDPNGEMEGLEDDVRGYSIAANVLMLGGAAFAVVGTIWWIVAAKRDKSQRAEKATASFRPLLGPAQAGAIVEF